MWSSACATGLVDKTTKYNSYGCDTAGGRSDDVYD